MEMQYQGGSKMRFACLIHGVKNLRTVWGRSQKVYYSEKKIEKVRESDGVARH